jgi:hypothetical protein
VDGGRAPYLITSSTRPIKGQGGLGGNIKIEQQREIAPENWREKEKREANRDTESIRGKYTESGSGLKWKKILGGG